MPPTHPTGLAAFDGIVMRSSHTGRIREWLMRDATGEEMVAPLKRTLAFDDPEAMCRAALLGLGVTLIAVPHALPQWRAPAPRPKMVCRRRTDLDHYASRTLLPAKTRVFVDFVVEAFRQRRLAERFASSIG
jgi:DNA-binding transcriptional LysR family regulator